MRPLKELPIALITILIGLPMLSVMLIVRKKYIKAANVIVSGVYAAVLLVSVWVFLGFAAFAKCFAVYAIVAISLTVIQSKIEKKSISDIASESVINKHLVMASMKDQIVMNTDGFIGQCKIMFNHLKYIANNA